MGFNKEIVFNSADHKGEKGKEIPVLNDAGEVVGSCTIHNHVGIASIYDKKFYASIDPALGTDKSSLSLCYKDKDGNVKFVKQSKDVK